MLETVLRTLLRNLIGSGADISVANPVPVTMGELPVESGTATGGTGATCEDTTKDWEINMWTDFVIEVDIGGIEYHRTIITNTADTLTFNALGGIIVVAAGDNYEIRSTGAVPAAAVTVDNFTDAAGANIVPAVVQSSLVTDFTALKVTIHFAAATSNPVTIALDANTGGVYDTVLRVITMGANTDMVYYFPAGAKFEAGDVITIAWTNDIGALAWAVLITTE